MTRHKRHKKNMSITMRLFLYIVSVVLGISVLIMLSNTLLLKPLYFSSIKSTMLRSIETLSQIDYSKDTETWVEELTAQTAGNAYDVVIRTDDGTIFSSSREFGLTPRPAITPSLLDDFDQEDDFDDDQILQPPDDDQPFYNNLDDDIWEKVGDNTYMATITEPKSKIEMLVCTMSLDSGVKISLTQAIEPMNQSIRQSNILLLACALLALAISVIFAFKMSKSFTRPIKQIQNTVGEIAALNFGNKCDVNTGDELQSLSEDVNSLSDELENALNTLRRQNIQLEKDIIAQRQFISNASHELRTPLALIKGYADEMTSGFAQDSKQKDFYIEIIAEEAAKMNRLLKEMLELTRMESGRVELIYEDLSVNERIQSFIEKYDGYISENGLNISLDLSENVTGHFDAMRFEQILANYISNAARYGDENKTVRISTKVMDGIVRVSVFNTGNPISEELKESIWDGFFKADDARTRIKDSYGLGLSVVKAIQNVAGQQFGAENVPGGVCFWFDVQQTFAAEDKI